MVFGVTAKRDEDGVWVAECPLIPGCVSQGKTKQESLKRIRAAIKLCLQVRTKKGLPLTIETEQIEVHWPAVPRWIRDFSCPGWTNAFHLLPTNNRLYGTETLFGDWNSRVLLLLKDWGPTSELELGIADPKETNPWRHAQRELGDKGGWRTNERLAEFASVLPGGKLYGSATANMLYNEKGWSRALKGFKSEPLQAFLPRVLQWVLESMPQVETVACCGKEAWYLTCITIGKPALANRHKEHRDSFTAVTGTVGNKLITAFPLYHPVARVTYDAKAKGWLKLAALTNSWT